MLMKTLRNIFEKLCDMISISSTIHNINIDDGMFNVAILGNHKTASVGDIIKVIRITEVPHNVMNPSIKVMTSDKKFINVDIISPNSEWQFIMPDDDIVIIPTIKRKF